MCTLDYGRRLAATLLLLTVGLTACSDERQEYPFEPVVEVRADVSSSDRALDVYTQNVYLGGDTGPLFTIDFSNIPAVLAAVGGFWQQVQASDVPRRMAAIVDEIEQQRPHIVGLQEVLQFVVLDAATFQPIEVVDLLGEIQAELAARGLDYVTEAVQPGTSAILPLGFDPTVGITSLLQFQDRLVVLRRGDVESLATAHGRYAASVPIAVTPLGPVELVRGWIRASVELNGVPYHYINTHLEVQAIAPVQAAQANELLTSVAANLEGVTIIAGDLNSDAAAEEGAPSWTPTYGQLREAGFTDIWERSVRSGSTEGLTCCQATGLNQPSELDERIDFVLARGSDGYTDGQQELRGRLLADVVGESPSDLTPSGLWPSDHAGIAAQLLVGPHRFRSFKPERNW